jgi:hypothetical protein
MLPGVEEKVTTGVKRVVPNIVSGLWDFSWVTGRVGRTTIMLRDAYDSQEPISQSINQASGMSNTKDIN